MRLLSICRVGASVLLVLVVFVSSLAAQSTELSDAPVPQSESSAAPVEESKPSFLSGAFARQLLTDQKEIWTSPLRIKASDVKWLLPLAGATASALQRDGAINHRFDNQPLLQKTSLKVSKAGTYAEFGVPGAFLLLGKLTGNDRVADTGRRTFQAALYSTLVMQGLKQATNRTRPYQGGDGHFWTGGNSFPSGHSAEAWALAKVVSDEYSDKPFVKFGAYGFAAAVSLSRMTSQRHYASDVIVGSALGYLVGKFIMRDHRAQAH